MAVWDGYFKLDIAIKTDSKNSGESETESLPSRIDPNSICLRRAWNVIERDAMLTENSSEEFGFRASDFKRELAIGNLRALLWSRRTTRTLFNLQLTQVRCR